MRLGRVRAVALSSAEGGRPSSRLGPPLSCLGVDVTPHLPPPRPRRRAVLACSKIEEQTRAVLSGTDINDIYDDGGNLVVEESFAEGDGVLREAVPTA